MFNSAQYFAAVLFTPLMAYLTHAHGWRSVYFVMGGLGLALAVLWLYAIHEPRSHPRISRAELEYIERGGGLVSLEQQSAAKAPLPRGAVKQLLANRMMMGIYVAQYCINTLTYFFLTGSRCTWCRSAGCPSSRRASSRRCRRWRGSSVACWVA
ncbi:MFS transporter [Cystobacter fuscus]